MTDPQAARPDGRQPPSEVLALRQATRSLRVHLDQLPIDFDLDVDSGQFLAGVAFMSARQRYACAESLIGAGFGGTALGSIARSLLVDALRWLWIGGDPDRVTLLVGDLLKERSGICEVLERENSTCPNLRAWLEPLPGLISISAPVPTPQLAMPTERSLLAALVGGLGDEFTDESNELLQRASRLIGGVELRGATLVLAHAGHGNYLGLQSSLAEGSAIGHDLRFDHEALFMQLGAAGAVATAVASSAVTDHWWPGEIPRVAFLERALALCNEVSDTALQVHRLAARSRSVAISERPPLQADHFTPSSLLTTSPPPAFPPSPYPHALVAAAERYYLASRNLSFDPWDRSERTLHPLLGWTGALSNLEAVFATYEQPGAGVIGTFAARALLEEAARTHWRYSEPNEGAFQERATQFFDEFRFRKRKTINLLVGGGVPRPIAEQFFTLPSYVDPSSVTSDPRPGRVPIPSVTEMLDQLSARYPEPGWMTVAYSLLSQTTHATPLGLLHSIAINRDGTLAGGTISNEMLGLTLDITCTASSVILGISALVLTGASSDAFSYQRRLDAAALEVHDAARLVHGLD